MIEKYKVERGVKIKRSSLKNNDYNPNKTTQRQQEAIAESLNNYGQLTSVLVRPDPDDKNRYIIIDGEHRGQVLQDEIFVDIVHDLSLSDAKKLTIIMNETRGSADKIELAQLLASLNDSFDDLREGLPYNEDELAELLELAKVDWDKFDLPTEQNSTNDPTEDDWETITFKLPRDAMDLFNQASDLIKVDKALHKDKAIAYGQIIQCLVAEYLAMPCTEQN